MQSKCFLILLAILPTIVSVVTRGQETVAFKIPENVISVLTVPDPKCPVEISGPFNVLGFRSGGIFLGYTIRNVSNVDIKEFEIEELNWFDSMGYNWPAKVNKKYKFAPGQHLSTLELKKDLRLLPYDSLIAEEIGLSGDSNRIWLVVVTGVRFADGSSCDGSHRYRLIKRFLAELHPDRKSTGREMNDAELRLREFLSELSVQTKRF